MRNTITRFIASLLIIFAGAILVKDVAAQGFEIKFEADSDVLAADDRVTFTLTASNTGSTTLLDVTAEVLLPELIDTFVDTEEFNCVGNCDAGETAVWTIGTLEPGKTRTVFFQTFIQVNAAEGEISGRATVTLPGVSDIVETVEVLIDNSRAMRVSVSPASGPADAGMPFVYTLTVTNIGDASVVSPDLAFKIPGGASFVEATDGGVAAGNEVTWDLGVFGAGAGRQLRVTILPDAGLDDGHLLVATATLDPNETNEAVVQAVDVMPVRASVPLRFEYGINQTAAGTDDRLVYELTATNNGSTALLDVSALVHLPQSIDTFVDDPEFDCVGNCDQNELATWTIGTLEPGQTRTVLFQTFVGAAAPAGHIMKSRLIGTSTGSGQVFASLDTHVDALPRMRLNVSPASGPAAAGEPFEYSLTVTNYGASSIVSPELSFYMPEGVTLVSASDGGAVQEDVITWDLGVMGAGAGRQLYVTVLPNADLPDGHLLVARATADPQETNVTVVRSIAVTPVRDNVPLRLEYGISRTAPGADDQIIYHLTATNTGATPLLDVSAEVMLPEWVDTFVDDPEFDCIGNCDRNEVALWTIGTLESGQTRTVYFETFAAANVAAGHLFTTRLLATSTGSGQVMASLDAHADPSPRMQMSVAPEKSPAVAGQLLTYSITLGNTGAANPGNIDVTFELPVGVTADAISDGGVENGGVITWDLSPLMAGQGRKLQVDVLVDASLDPGHLLVGRVSLIPNELNESTRRSITVVPVGAPASVDLEYITNQPAYAPGDQVAVTLNATNAGVSDLLDLTVAVELPLFINTFLTTDELACIGNCDQNETATWSIGTLSPGQTRTDDIITSVIANANPGEIMNTRFEIQPTSGEQIFYFRDELIGTLANAAPTSVSITDPADGMMIMLGGTTAGDAGDPAELLNVTWTEASDPEGDALTYTWQLSTTQDFSGPVYNLASDAGTPTQVTVSHGTLAAWLDSEGVLPGVATTLYHRVLVSDGTNSVASAVLSIALTRGTLVGIEAGGLPTRFALHASYPNPFNPVTTFSYDVPQAGPVRIDVFNAQGQLVKTLVDGTQPAGVYEVRLDLQNHPSGVYFYRLQAGGFEAVRQMVLMK